MKLYDHDGAVVWTITEREGPLRRPEELFPDYDAGIGVPLLEAMPAEAFAPATGRMTTTYQSFLLSWAGKMIMIDTCVGEAKPRPPFFGYAKQDWPATLKRTGIGVDRIDHVICTHLHVDHVGWNTTLEAGRWVPTFPNAVYWFGSEECAHLEAMAKAGQDLAGRIWADSVLPLIAGGQARLVPMEHDFGHGIRFRPAPGHTPGMFRVDVETGGSKLIFATDIMHQPLQVRLPEWSTSFCVDPAMASATRRAFLEEVVDTTAILFPEHFAYPVAGRVIRQGPGFAYRYLDGRVL